MRVLKNITKGDTQMPTKKNRITVVIEDDMYQEIRKIAQQHDKSMNYVVRCLLDSNLNKLELSNLSETDIQEMHEVNKEMRDMTSILVGAFGKVECMVRKMGININQIAKKAHSDGLNDSDIEECIAIAEKNNLLINKLGGWLSNGNYKDKQSS